MTSKAAAAATDRDRRANRPRTHASARPAATIALATANRAPSTCARSTSTARDVGVTRRQVCITKSTVPAPASPPSVA